MNSFFSEYQGQVFSQWRIQSVMKNDEHHNNNNNNKKQDIESNIKTPNPKTESKIKLPKSQTPKSIKIQDPKSKLQNRDQKASKRVCPTRVCLTSVSARPSAQQLRPQRLKLLNPLWPFILMCCLPNFFLSSELRCFTWNFGWWLVFPKNQDNFLFLANSPAQWAKCQAGNHPRSVQSLAHKRFVSQKSGKNWWEKFCESFVYVYNCGVECTCHERNMKKKLSTAPLRATLGTLRAGSPFRVLPQPSLEGMSALSTPSASKTQPRGWGPKSQTQKSI